jgi:tetratricopeptide (TPR) repeat protein
MAARKTKKNSVPKLQANDFIQLSNLAAILEQLATPLIDEADDKALDKAKEIFYKACEAPGKKRRIALAKKAIEISPLCADAYVLLAEHEARASDVQLALYRQALEGGRKAIGDEFDELTGEFWGWLETRPFMRAKLGLAICLWERNEREEALKHLREMLHLNPNDNQGVRSILAAYLLESSLHAELAALLKAYKDDTSTNLSFSRALLLFRLHGDSAKSRKALAAAVKQNKHVRLYVTGEKALPKSLPPFYSWGDDSEAVHYADGFKKGWDETPGAIDWLRDFMEAANTAAPAKRASKTKPRVQGTLFSDAAE